MGMNNSGGIEDLLAPLKQRMQKLEEENQMLRMQLAQVQQENTNMKRGIGITVLIDGKPVQIGGQSPDASQPPMMMPPPSSSVPPGSAGPFATPAIVNERRGPMTTPANSPSATIPNLFGSAPKSYTPPPTPAPATANTSDNRPNSRGSGYADFFLD